MLARRGGALGGAALRILGDRCLDPRDEGCLQRPRYPLPDLQERRQVGGGDKCLDQWLKLDRAGGRRIRTDGLTQIFLKREVKLDRTDQAHRISGVVWKRLRAQVCGQELNEWIGHETCFRYARGLHP